MKFRHLAFAAACLAALSVPAFAETNVTILHVNDVEAAKALWNNIAADYNAAHQGVKVQFKYLENEAFKAKLPTMLQSANSRPDAFYSWAGGVMQAQDKAGLLKDITKDVADVEANMSPTAVDAFKVDGKVVGVPFEMGEVAFFYNKKLFEKAGVKAEDLKDWDGFLAAVKKLKAAGIAPIVVGAGEKWPMAFFYDYLVLRVGGQTALARREGRQERRLQERGLRRGRQAASRARRRSNRSSPVISRPRMRSRPASSATARRRWT